MNNRIVWSLAAAAIFAGASSVAAAQGMGSGMMGGMMRGHSPGMMYAAASSTQVGPNTSARPGYYGMGRGVMGRNGRYGGYGMGSGMMGGYGGYGMGPGMMGGYGGYGMGPGMMGGYGGYGMGPGMMGGYGGYGMGPGMMGGYGGYGMGPGIMYGYGAQAFGLTSQQHDKIAEIWNKAMQQSWPIMGELREQHFQLAQLMNQENPDRAEVNKVYGRISDLRRKLLDQRLEARQQMLQVLTSKQRKQLQQGFYRPQR